jgi:hypothetical protein
VWYTELRVQGLSRGRAQRGGGLADQVAAGACGGMGIVQEAGLAAAG